jgi:hypothetical protein
MSGSLSTARIVAGRSATHSPALRRRTPRDSIDKQFEVSRRMRWVSASSNRRRKTPDRRANGNEGIGRIARRHGTCRPGIDDDIPVRGRVEVPKQRHNCVGGGTNLSNQLGFIGPSDANRALAFAMSKAARLSGLIAGFAQGACTMPFTAAKLGAVQGSVIVVGGWQEAKLSRPWSSARADASHVGTRQTSNA